jgi:hypothetical protein
MMPDWIAVLMPCSATLAFMMALRLTGVTSHRLSVPRSISSSIPMPAHMFDEMALITTTPGTT